MTRKGKGNKEYDENKRTHKDARRTLPPQPMSDAYAANKERYYTAHKAKISKKNKARYAANKDKIKAATRARRTEIYYKIFKIRYDAACTVCGYSDYRALDFHHVEPADKIDTIAQLANRSVSWHRIETELAKCVPICANCHRIEHYRDHRAHEKSNFEDRYMQEKAWKSRHEGRGSEEE